MTARIRNPKWVFTFQITGEVPTLVNEYGDRLTPYRVVVTQWESRCKVEVTGKSQFGPGSARSAVFRMSGYETTNKVPEWLMQLIVDAGFPVKELEVT